MTHAASTTNPQQENGNYLIHAQALHAERFSMQAFEGFTRLRVLTYSASIPMIVNMLNLFDEFECIFGYERLALGLSDIWAFQQITNTQLVQAVYGLHDRQRMTLFDKVQAGKAQFFVLKDGKSHAKLYLLDSPTRRRVIVGSSNLSIQALVGLPTTSSYGQLELNINFDDDDLAWSTCEQIYEDVRTRSTSEVHIPLREAQLAETSFEDIPINREAAISDVVIAIQATHLPTIVLPKAERLSKTYMAIAEQVSKTKNTYTLTPRVIGKLATLIRSRKDDGTSAIETLAIQRETQQMVVAGKPISLCVGQQAIQQDAALLVEYLENFQNGFAGPVARQQRIYFTFMAWFYLSPLMCDLLNHAKFNDLFTYRYPMFAVLYGKSNCGKTRLVETLMISMFGHHKFRASSDLVPSTLPGLQVESQRFPVAFDDVEKDRFKNAYSLIKSTTDSVVTEAEFAPFVFSMNADEGHAFPDEIRKRCALFYTSASLPRNREEGVANYNTVKHIQKQLGTAFYREYLRRALLKLSSAIPDDYLAFSSGILCELFAQAVGDPLPAWCTPTDLREFESVQDEKTKHTLLQLWETNRKAWKIKHDVIVLRLEPTEVHGLRKDIPGWILKEGASKGGNLVMDRGGLEDFLQRSLSPSIWQRWFR